VDSGTELDTAFLEELLDGDKEFAQELFETYCESADTALLDAERLLAANDLEKSFRPFHTLKGASASVGLLNMQETARRLEVAAKAGEIQNCQAQLPGLRLAVEDAKRLLNEYLAAL